MIVPQMKDELRLFKAWAQGADVKLFTYKGLPKHVSDVFRLYQNKFVQLSDINMMALLPAAAIQRVRKLE